MKKLLTVLFALALIVGLWLPADAATQYYRAEVYRLVNTGDVADSSTRITSGITYKVLATDSDTSETLGSDKVMTSKTNPITTTIYNSQDRVDFYCDPTDSGDLQVDLIVVDTNGGFTAFIEDFTPYKHRIIIDERPNVMHHGMIWFGASDNSATDTGVNFLPDTFVHDVRVEVVTIDANETLGVGTGDTATGFRLAVSVTTGTEGYPTDTAVITNGSTSDYVPVTTYGALLVTAITGSDSAAGHGGKSYIGHIVTTSGTDDDLYYTGSAGSDTAAGYIHYWISRLR